MSGSERGNHGVLSFGSGDLNIVRSGSGLDAVVPVSSRVDDVGSSRARGPLLAEIGFDQEEDVLVDNAVLSDSMESLSGVKIGDVCKYFYKKKAFGFKASEFVCTFCGKRGHQNYFCPLQSDSSDYSSDLAVQAFADALLLSPVIDPMIMYGGLSWDEIRNKVEQVAAQWAPLNPWTGSRARGDQLRGHAHYWKAIGASRTVLAWIIFGVPVRPFCQPPRIQFRNHPSYFANLDFVDCEVAQHVADGVFIQVSAEHVAICSPLHVAVSSSGKRRLCLDARYVNSLLAGVSFSLDTLPRVLADLFPNLDVNLIPTDFEKAYYSCSLTPNGRKYFGFTHRGLFYVFTVLPFGSGQAPFFFNKIGRIQVAFCRAVSLRSFMFFDDVLWIVRRAEGEKLLAFIRWFLHALGWFASRKCAWKLLRRGDFTGWTIDVDKNVLALPEAKLERIRADLLHVLDVSDVPLRDLESLIGRLVFAHAVCPSIMIFLRACFAITSKAERETLEERRVRDPRCRVVLSDAARFDLSFLWRSIERLARCPLVPPVASCVLRCDASETGWGGVVGSASFFGEFDSRVIGTSSARRELLGLLSCARQAVDLICRRVVEVQLDSFSAFSNLVKGGGPCEDLVNIVRQWFFFCDAHDIQVFYRWIPRELNTQADILSKVFDCHWELSNFALRQLREYLPGVLLVSWPHFLVSRAWEAVDIFFCVVPEFNQLGFIVRTLRELTRTGSCALVHPRWMSQRWWPSLMDIVDRAFFLGSGFDVLVCRADSLRPLPHWDIMVSVIKKSV